MQQQEDARTKAAAARLAQSAALAEQEQAIEARKTELLMSNLERRAQIEDAYAERRTAVAQLAIDRQAQEVESQIGIASSISDGISSVLAEAATKWGQGLDVDLGAIVAKTMGGYIASLGASAIAAGTLAVALGTLGLFVPAIGLAFPAAAIPLGLATIAAGTLALGGGAYIASLASGGGGGGGGGARGALSPGGGGGRSAGGGSQLSGAAAGFTGGGQPQPITNVYNYSFNGPMGGSPRRIARDLRDLTTRGETLLPGTRSPGGR
jgi:hypothetical protein